MYLYILVCLPIIILLQANKVQLFIITIVVYDFMKQYIVSFCFRSKLVPFTCLSCPDASYSAQKRRALWTGQHL